jgi:S-adenosyl methyltransferase/Domain of unknown function (DUF397)
VPEARDIARANRGFLGRAVRYLAAEKGIRQFLDIGTGIPTTPNTHEIAQAVAPGAKVIYADNDRCKSGCAHACWGGQAVHGSGCYDRVEVGSAAPMIAVRDSKDPSGPAKAPGSCR